MRTGDFPRAAHTLIRFDPTTGPFIQAYRCGACGAVTTEQTMACRRCAVRAAPQPFRTTTHGQVHGWTVVERSFPGVAVPFISVIVDLEGGPTVKGTLRGVNPDAMRGALPVTLVFDDADGAADAHGLTYVGFHFVPQQAVHE